MALLAATTRWLAWMETVAPAALVAPVVWATSAHRRVKAAPMVGVVALVALVARLAASMLQMAMAGLVVMAAQVAMARPVLTVLP